MTMLFHEIIHVRHGKILQRWPSELVSKKLTQDTWAAAPAGISLASPFLLLGGAFLAFLSPSVQGLALNPHRACKTERVLPEPEDHKEQPLQTQSFPTVSHHDPKHSGKSGLGSPEHKDPVPGLGMKATVLPQQKASCLAAPPTLPCRRYASHCHMPALIHSLTALIRHQFS